MSPTSAGSSTGAIEILRHALVDQHRIGVAMLGDIHFANQLTAVTDEIERCLRSGGTLFFAGNGGSAAAASHFATEMVGRFRQERSGFRAISLSSDAALLTALANDYPVTELFARQLAALGRTGDVLVCLTTSGRSPNILTAVGRAEALGIVPIILCGHYTDQVHGHGIVMSVPSSDTARIQELHNLVLHSVTERVEANLVG